MTTPHLAYLNIRKHLIFVTCINEYGFLNENGLKRIILEEEEHLVVKKNTHKKYLRNDKPFLSFNKRFTNVFPYCCISEHSNFLYYFSKKSYTFLEDNGGGVNK